MSEKSKTLCPIPWNHLAIQQNGNYRACCQCIKFPFGILTDNNGKPMNVNTHSFDEARNSQLLKDIRSAMMRGEKPSDCDLCWEEEKIGLESRRRSVMNKFDTPNLDETSSDGTINTKEIPLEYMDIRFGNLCNQACRSCGPTDSSLWYADAEKTSKEFSFYGYKTYKFIRNGNSITIDSDDFNWYNKPNFEQEFKENVDNIKRIYFTGGEPTINKAHFNLLQFCIDIGIAKNIVLEYNSNIMAIPENLLNQWSHFSLVNIGASVDAYGDLANYVRWPSEWDKIEKNILYLDSQDICKNINIGVSSTISILNILNFIDLTKWMLGNDFQRIIRIPTFHMLNGPYHLNVQNLPNDTKEMIVSKYDSFFEYVRQNHAEHISLIERYKSIITFMFEKSCDLTQLKLFFSKMQQLDQSRNQDLLTALPWIQNVKDQTLGA